MCGSMKRAVLLAACLGCLSAQASACDLAAIDRRLAAADEHLFWSEFWSDLDRREATAELGFGAHDLRQAVRLSQDPACDHVRRSAELGQVAERRLALVGRTALQMAAQEAPAGR